MRSSLFILTLMFLNNKYKWARTPKGTEKRVQQGRELTQQTRPAPLLEKDNRNMGARHPEKLRESSIDQTEPVSSLIKFSTEGGREVSPTEGNSNQIHFYSFFLFVFGSNTKSIFTLKENKFCRHLSDILLALKLPNYVKNEKSPSFF